MYIFPYHDDIDIVNKLESKLIANNIFIINGKSFGNKNCLRILLPINENELDLLITCLN